MKAVRKIAVIILQVLFCLNMLLLLVAIVSPYISPKFFWPPALAGLFFRVFFIIHLVFIALFLSIKRWKVFIVSVIVLLLCLPNVLNIFAVKANYKPAQQPNLTLMTYNVSAFGWHEDTTVNQVLANIRSANPDILCLQEYYLHPKEHKNVMRVLKKELGYTNYYEYVTEVLPRHNRVGMAIFSKLPFRNFNPIVFPNSSNGAFYVDFFTGKDTFRLINVHFQSFSLKKNEYIMPEISALRDSIEERKSMVKNSLQKFRFAFRKRSYQVQLVKDEIEKSPYKVIVAGDFNDTPTSYMYRQLTKELDDTWLKTGFGIGSTFAGKLPALRIDYVLASPEIPVAKTYVIKKKAGDHYPVVCKLNVER